MVVIQRISTDSNQGRVAQLKPGAGNNQYVRASDYNPLVDRVNSITDNSGAIVTANTVPTVGTGYDGAERAIWANVGSANGLKVVEFFTDLTGLIAVATDGDIIGDTALVASCHFGQITSAVFGTLIGCQVICMEAPAGGSADIDVYSATASTGAQDGAISGLSGTALITAGGAWTNGAVKGMTALPAANEYLYLTNGAGSGAGTYSAGKFCFRFYGV